MIKILFIISHLQRQGPVMQLLYLCKNLDKKIVEPIIITTSPVQLDSTLHDDFKKHDIRIIDLNISKLKSVFQASKIIQSFIDNNKITIVQSFGFRSDIIASKLKKVYKITTIRNTVLYNYKMIYGKFWGHIFGKINLHFVKKFNTIVACSESIMNYLLTLNIESIAILNAFDMPEGISYKKKYIKSLDDKITYITISSNLKGKNIEFLLNAFTMEEILKEQILIVAGFVEANIIEKYKSIPNIKFLGKIKNVLEELNNADFFISSSLHEGMPNAVLESMAVGTPVILSDIPSHQEIIDLSDVEIGIIFKNNDINDFKYKINEILKEDHQLLSNNCKTVIKDKFNAVDMAKKYTNLYRKALQ